MSKINARTSIEELAALVSEKLRQSGIDAVLSGGAVVSIYTQNAYESGDLDFISNESMDTVAVAMQTLGFSRRGRSFTHPGTSLFVEFPPGPLAIGNELVLASDVLDRKTKHGILRLLPPTQCVMDRLAAFFHWNDLQSLDQAIMVAQQHKISLRKIEAWAKNEGMSDKFSVFKTRLKNLKR